MPKSTNTPPLKARQISADMALKHVTLREVASAAQVPYETASAILNGRINHPRYLRQLEAAVKAMPMPASV